MANIKLAVDRLTIGLYVKLPLQWTEHPFLLNHFKIKDKQQLRLIKNLNLKYVYLIPEKSDTTPLAPDSQPEAISEQESQYLDKQAEKLWQEKQRRIEHLKNYKLRVQRCEKNFSRSLSQLRSIVSKIKSRPLNAVEEAHDLVSTMVDALMESDNVALHLMNDKKEHEDIYFHSLNVAIISMMLAKSNGMSAEAIKNIALGALFHDMGKLKVPTAILRKTTPLTQPEENYLRLHTKYSLELANLADTFPEASKPILDQHHELVDGSGYPQGLKGDEIDNCAQLVAVVNAYDTLCHPQDPSKARIPYSALSYLFKNKKDQYNNEYMALLVKLMGVYPPGSVVQLSNQQLGLVISVNTNSLLHPNVLLYDPTVPSNEAPIIDLEEGELKIERAVSPNKLPEHVYDYLNPRVRISFYFDPDD
ncbi:HD family phosphohydrolase [Photobacterium jeanii]|uniref:HD family phosphohydrolase n=2 Tax=Vibrionaceae TaxID=641 RepID=A0A178KH52_9GAMM|nr:HD-GYP domain-containing protein [Photobacterium jeanii]OAN16618.1 HD family phosphohydrolase [Photobacterium jeanii]PST88011.1 HD-GYP domain-containing protein [Photobacterium jeanii]